MTGLSNLAPAKHEEILTKTIALFNLRLNTAEISVRNFWYSVDARLDSPGLWHSGCEDIRGHFGITSIKMHPSLKQVEN